MSKQADIGSLCASNIMLWVIVTLLVVCQFQSCYDKQTYKTELWQWKTEQRLNALEHGGCQP